MGRVLFTATDFVNGTELWSTDGTKAGTNMVRDLSPGQTATQGPKGTQFSDIVSLGDNAVFAARSYDDQSYTFYASDGTSEGTVVLGEFQYFQNFVSILDGKAFFAATPFDGTDGSVLFQTDGTASGTFQVSTLGLHTNFNADTTSVTTETRHYFFGKTEDHTYDNLYNLFQYQDGALADTGVAAGSQYGMAPAMLPVHGGFVFPNYSEDTGSELWFSDGTTAGTHMVKDIMPGALGGLLDNFHIMTEWVPVDGKVLFTANDGSGRSLWITDGTENGTYMVHDFFEDNRSPNYLSLNPNDHFGRLQDRAPITAGDHTLFVINDGSIPDYTWAYDSSTETAAPLHFIAGDGREVRSESGTFYSVDGDIYFAGFTMDGGDTSEYVDIVALFKAEGGTWKTELVKDINTSSGQGAYGLAIDDIQVGIEYAGRFVFPMYDRITYDSFGHPLFNSEPWISDGTEAGTYNIKEIAPGTTLYDGTDLEFSGSSPDVFTVVGDGRTSGLADTITMSPADYGRSVDGMGGVDTADYSGFSAGIDANLNTGRSILRGDAGTASLTKLTHIENLIGTHYDDILSGDSGNNQFHGGAGFDTLVGGDGNDILDGGSNPDNQGDIMLGGDGDDTYYVDSALDLADEGFIFPDAGWGGTDTIISTANWYWDSQSVGEVVRIAEDADDPDDAGVTFVGGVFDNELNGHSGTDILFGRGGNDTYRAGDGVDWISLSTLGLTDENAYKGVDGHNTIIVDPRSTGAFSYDIIFEFESGKDKVDVSAYGSQYASGADVLSHAVDDGAGSSYIALGDGLDYLYFVGLSKAELLASDFIV